jgi:hypothetical protein
MTPQLPGTPTIEEERVELGEGRPQQRDLVEVGGKRIPPPIIEVHPVPPVEGWIKFAD